MKSEQTLRVEVRVQVATDSNLVTHTLRLLGESLSKTAHQEMAALPDGMLELTEIVVTHTCEQEHPLG